MRSSRASLSLATIRPAPLEAKLHAALTAGFGAVGLLWDEMAELGDDGLEEVRLSDLPVSDLAGVSGWMAEDRTSRSVALARAEQAFEFAARIDCPVVIAWPTADEIDPVTAAGDFRELCRLAGPSGRRVGLEFLGGAAQVNSVAAAWEIIDAAEADNGGLVLDAFHFHRGESTLEMLESVPGSAICLVQLSDCMRLPRHVMENRHRVYPGTGVLPLEALLASCRQKGYAGCYSLELHNEEYWSEAPLVVAREGLRSLRRLDIV